MSEFVKYQRPNYIDYTKFIVMFLVIYGHYIPFQGLEMADNPIWNSVHFINLYHMPVFFLISGILYKIKDPLEDIQNIKRTLIMPYIYIALLTTIVGLVLFGYWQDWKFVCKCILGIVSGNDLHGYGILPFSGPLWFLYALILVRLIMCVLIRADLVKWGGVFNMYNRSYNNVHGRQTPM